MTINSRISASFYSTLAKTQPPQHLWIIGYRNGTKTTQRIGIGLAPGTAIEILQRAAGNLVVRIGETHIGIHQQILVTD